ncbi:hypothetical protein BJV74DRAFT_889349 [Russula compacta]|nr:hypothetical protein BJV74DRAFT_889349 [Russula compacta]
MPSITHYIRYLIQNFADIDNLNINVWAQESQVSISVGSSFADSAYNLLMITIGPVGLSDTNVCPFILSLACKLPEMLLSYYVRRLYLMSHNVVLLVIVSGLAFLVLGKHAYY